MSENGKDTNTEDESAPEAQAEPAAAASEASDPGETVAEAQARADANWEKFLRVSAELENMRRRSAREVENARKFGLEKFAAEIINVRDSLELGLQAASDEAADLQSLREGSAMTLRLLTSTLDKFGIREIDPAGEPFDPEFHEAMSMQASDTAEPGSVLQVVQKGYLLNERLLRPARVIVARRAETETG